MKTDEKIEVLENFDLTDLASSKQTQEKKKEKADK